MVLLCGGKGGVLLLQVGQQIAEHPAAVGGGDKSLERHGHLCLLHQIQQGVHILLLEVGQYLLPTIISVSTTAIRAVPKSYKEGSLALGASHIETTFKVVVPAAKSGILAAIVLGCGRAIGETMAIILVGGNAVEIPKSIFDKVRPLTSNIALEMGYATESHQELLFATGVVLFAFILILNLVISKLSNKEGK